MQAKARAEGLWNLWLPADMAAKIAHLREKVPEAERHLLIGPGLSNLEYAFLSEIMGRVSHIGSEVFNCSAPDTGNMEVHLSGFYLQGCFEHKMPVRCNSWPVQDSLVEWPFL